MPTIIAVEFTEHERGRGQRPDGYTIHLDEEDAKRYSAAYVRRFNNQPTVPDEYSVPETPFKAHISDKEFQALKAFYESAECAEREPHQQCVRGEGRLVGREEDGRRTVKLRGGFMEKWG